VIFNKKLENKMDNFKNILLACSLAAFPALAGTTVAVASNTGNAVYTLTAANNSIASPVEVQDNVTVSGKVVDENGNPMPGVSVVLKGTTSGTITDTDGRFSIETPEGAVLIFSYQGYGTQEHDVTGSGNMGEIRLLPGDNGSDGLVNVAFDKKAESDIMSGISYVNTADVFPNYYSTYSLSGLSNMTTGYNGSIRGNDAMLVLVDGVPRNADNVLPSEIEQITVLKGPEASILYGSAGSKGALLITTKRGNVDGLKVTGSVHSGAVVAKRLPQYLCASEYMVVNNKVREAAGSQGIYSNSEIYYHSSANDNEYRYPDINYYSDDYIKRAYNYTDASIEMNGGNDRAHFYSNVGYFRNGTFLNFGEAKDGSTQRLNIRGNVDVNITKNISAFINANTTFYDVKSANGNFWEAAEQNRPNYPQHAAPLIPLSCIDENAADALQLVATSNHIIDGKYFLGGTQANKTNAIADMYAAGTNKYTSRHFDFDAGVKADLSSVLEGLYFKTTFSVDYATGYSTAFNESYATYEPVWSNINGEDKIIALNKMGNDSKSGVQNISGSQSARTVGVNAYFGYKNTFGGVNNVNAKLVANAYQKTVTDSYHRGANAALALSGEYNYDHKYYAELGLAIPHSAKLPEGNRNALSKSVTLGWNLANEDFLKGNSLISSLTIAASASDIAEDVDIDGYYLYSENWARAYGYAWADNNSIQYTYCAAAGNDDLGFVKEKSLSATLKLGLLNDMLVFSASAFSNKFEGFPVQPSISYPSYMRTGNISFVPYENYNDELRKGFEFGMDFSKQFGDVKTKLGVYGLVYDTERTKVAELYDYDYQNREGKAIDGIWGYECLGFFKSQEEIDNSPYQSLGETVRPGDLKYKDQNGDGYINDDDVVFLGKGGWYGAPFTMGLNLTVNYKNFTLFVMGSAYMNSYTVKNNSYYWMANGNDAKYSVIARDCWTLDNTDAAYPRISTGSGANNYKTSDFWMFKNNRFELQAVQLSYDLPSNLFVGHFIKGVSTFIQGTDLFMISKERKYLETNIGSAPQTRRFLAGVKVVF
jgi:TonB-linked SusC/RagA family outer membrane protein